MSQRRHWCLPTSFEIIRTPVKQWVPPRSLDKGDWVEVMHGTKHSVGCVGEVINADRGAPDRIIVSIKAMSDGSPVDYKNRGAILPIELNNLRKLSDLEILYYGVD